MIEQPGSSFLLRAVYFVLVGWWATLVWINVAWALNATIIGLPLGLWMINRVPQVLTLRPMAVEREVHMRGDRVYVETRDVRQYGCLIRLLYFLVIGSWASLIWANVAWLLCVSIIGLPIGLAMFNSLPTVTTLMRTA
jgi:uncharacterized membrane protein YccF (DUF307 family)